MPTPNYFHPDMMPCIEAFFRGIHPTLTPGQNLYPEVFATGHFFPLQRMRETEKMMAIARRYDPVRIVEIGADKGGSVYHWLMAFPKAEVTAIEVEGVPYEDVFNANFDQRLDSYPDGSRDKWVLADIEDGLLSYAPLIDVLFIDGEKPAMYDDFIAYLPFMSSDSVVFLHDINDSYGATALKRIKKDGHKNIQEVIDTTEVAEVQGRPPRNSYEQWLQHWGGRSAGFAAIYIGEPR